MILLESLSPKLKHQIVRARSQFTHRGDPSQQIVQCVELLMKCHLQTAETLRFQQSRRCIDMSVSQPSPDSQGSCLIPAARGRRCRQQQVCHLRHRRYHDDSLQPTLAPSTNDSRSPFHSLRVLNRGAAKFHDYQSLARHAQAVTATAFAETDSRRDAKLIELTRPGQHFGVQQRCARSPANRVVRKDNELPVQQIAFAQPPHRSCHAVSTHPVQPRLRSVDARVIFHGLVRSRRQMQTLQRQKLLPRRKNLVPAQPSP